VRPLARYRNRDRCNNIGFRFIEIDTQNLCAPKNSNPHQLNVDSLRSYLHFFSLMLLNNMRGIDILARVP